MLEIGTILIILLVFMIIGSLIAIETPDLLSSVISVGAVGAGVSIAFLFLGAPDIAITQLVVEVLVLIILIRATVRRDDTTARHRSEKFANISVLTFVGAMAILALAIFRDLPPFGRPLLTVARDYIDNGLDLGGAANLVTATILNFRGYDTLGEATVLFAAIIGALVVLRKVGRKGKGEAEEE